MTLADSPQTHSAAAPVWQTARFRIDLASPRIMGIVNVTPDSFSDGGRFGAAAIKHAEALLAQGADILDIGGESTRPGAIPISAEEELARVLPVLDAALTWGCPVSIDTRRTDVMRAVLARGADIVNDIDALRAPGAMEAVAEHGRCGVCLMHMQGEPLTMQDRPAYDDVLGEVGGFLAERLVATRAAGISDDRIVLDPGIGFGKRVEDNFALLRRQAELLALGRPLLVGWSRKSALGALTGRDVDHRAAASLAAALAAIGRGARIVRVHDVAATRDAVSVWVAAGLAGPARQG